MKVFLKMGQSRPLFVYFRYFLDGGHCQPPWMFTPKFVWLEGQYGSTCLGSPSRPMPSTSLMSCPILSPPAWNAAPLGWMEMILGRGCFVFAPPSMAIPNVDEHLGTWIVCRPMRMWDKGGSGRRAGWKRRRENSKVHFWPFLNKLLLQSFWMENWPVDRRRERMVKSHCFCTFRSRTMYSLFTL